MVGWALRRAREVADPLSLRRAGAGTGREGVVPPRRLRARTGAPGIREFLDGGGQAARELSAALGATGSSLDRAGSVLDFGCGSARVLPRIATLVPTAVCAGCDVDSSAIAWAVRHRPELEWSVSRFQPPLPFAEESFDLVYSISVFSHLDEPLQDEWLQEMRRILRPGGVALLSVHGGYAFEQFRIGRVRTAWCRKSAFDRAPLSPTELAFEPYRRSVFNAADLQGVGNQYGLAFHGGDYLRERWSRALEVVAILERAMTGWQDIVVCRRQRA